MDPTALSPVQRFASGFSSPYRAGRYLLQHPSLLPLVLIPVAINIVVFTAAVWAGLHLFGTTVIHYLPHDHAWYWQMLSYLLWLVAILLTMVLVFFGFSAVGTLIASPFNDLLSERTEELLTGRSLAEPFSLRQFLGDAIRTLVEEGKKILVFLAGMGLLLLLNFLPVVGTLLYAGLSLAWTVTFLAVEYSGYIAGRKRMTFARQRRYLLGRKLVMVGFGCGLLCLLAIPFLQFLCIPLGVIAATQLWCADPPRPDDREEQK